MRYCRDFFLLFFFGGFFHVFFPGQKARASSSSSTGRAIGPMCTRVFYFFQLLPLVLRPSLLLGDQVNLFAKDIINFIKDFKSHTRICVCAKAGLFLSKAAAEFYITDLVGIIFRDRIAVYMSKKRYMVY